MTDPNLAQLLGRLEGKVDLILGAHRSYQEKTDERLAVLEKFQADTTTTQAVLSGQLSLIKRVGYALIAVVGFALGNTYIMEHFKR